jgi:hypothetical protein
MRVLVPELFAQQSLLAAHTNERAQSESEQPGRKPHPMTLRQPGRDQHSKHPSVNRVAHKTIRPAPDQRMTLENARLQAPLFSQGAPGRRRDPERSRDERDDDSRHHYLKPVAQR